MYFLIVYSDSMIILVERRSWEFWNIYFFLAKERG